MKILILADGRSPITKSWIESLRTLHHEVILVSSYPCDRLETVDDFYILPIAFAKYAGNQAAPQGSNPEKKNSRKNKKRETIKRFRFLFMSLRYILGALTIPYYGRSLRKIVEKTKPDIVHALRIPFEGMTASYLPYRIPLAVSIWGNDLTLHASGSSLMKKLTIRTLERANGLVADAQRDIRLGKLWGFDGKKMTLVVPGNGGIDITATRISAEQGDKSLKWIPQNQQIVVNPRGFRPGSVRSDTFFRSIPLILGQFPNTIFLCCSMANQPEAIDWVNRLKVGKQVMLLPVLPQEMLWSIFRRAKVTVSVSQHDGTPNSLLEAMTCGCFPVAGDIESMREWITPGINGLLVNPDSPEELAAAVINALQNDNLRASAAAINIAKIRDKSEISVVQTAIEVFYNQLKGK